MTEHVIARIDRLSMGERGTSWHRVQCSCGWIRRYVSRHSAETGHAKHADREVVAIGDEVVTA